MKLSIRRNITTRFAGLLLAAVVLVLPLAGCTQQGMPESVTNRDVINFREFSLDASSVNLTTWTRGTVFVKGDPEKPDDITVQIVMDIELDPTDWGGVGLIFPEGWKVTGVSNSLVEFNDPYYNNLAGILTNGQPEDGGRSWVSVGYPSTLEGNIFTDVTGSLVVDADYVWKGKSTPEVLDLTVAVGSKDGYVVHPVSTHVEVPLLEDFRPARVQFLFPRQPQPEEFDASGEITGELVLENNELRLNGYLVLWPRDCYGWSDSQTVWIKDSETGESIARVGETLTITGKEVDSRTASEKASDYSYPGYPFDGPYWLADTVTVEQ